MPLCVYDNPGRRPARRLRAWYSVLGGLWPQVCLALTRAARRADSTTALQLAQRLDPIWQLFDQYGSLRVVSAIAEHAGLVESPNLPDP